MTVGPGGIAVARCPFCPPGVERVCFARAPGLRALVNLRPILEGHTLIVPERHVGRLSDLVRDEVAGLAVFAQAITILLIRELRASGIDWTVQDGAAAGQTVPHLHLHLIPRVAGDLPSPGAWYPELQVSEARPALSERDLQASVQRWRRAWRLAAPPP